jgi:hypothetical protein
LGTRNLLAAAAAAAAAAAVEWSVERVVEDAVAVAADEITVDEITAAVTVAVEEIGIMSRGEVQGRGGKGG